MQHEFANIFTCNNSIMGTGRRNVSTIQSRVIKSMKQVYQSVSIVINECKLLPLVVRVEITGFILQIITYNHNKSTDWLFLLLRLTIFKWCSQQYNKVWQIWFQIHTSDSFHLHFKDAISLFHSPKHLNPKWFIW